MPAMRQRLVMRYVGERGGVQVRALADALGVSEATVRRDLAGLAKQGLVQRTHGGAVALRTGTSFERRSEEKRATCTAQKRRIAESAALLVHDGETVILDSGSTTLEVARYLVERKGLTLITNDLFIATQVRFDASTRVILPGGERRADFDTLVGPTTEAFYRGIRVDLAFLSADAVDVEFGVTEASFAEQAVKQRLLEAGRQVVLVADASKFGRRALVLVCAIDAVDRVVTDDALPADQLRALEQAQVEVVLA